MSLSHQSPEITCIHTKEYLHWLEEQAHQTAINPQHSPGHSYESLKMALRHVGATLNATNGELLTMQKNQIKIQFLSHIPAYL